MGDLAALGRVQILDANDMLDALEEAEDDAKAKAEAVPKPKRGRR